MMPDAQRIIRHMIIAFKTFYFGVITIQPVGGSHPNISIQILTKSANKIIGQRGEIVGCMLKTIELPLFGSEILESGMAVLPPQCQHQQKTDQNSQQPITMCFSHTQMVIHFEPI